MNKKEWEEFLGHSVGLRTIGPGNDMIIDASPLMVAKVQRMEAADNDAHLNAAKWCLEQATTVEDRYLSDAYKGVAYMLLEHPYEEKVEYKEEKGDEDGTHESDA